MNIGHLHSKSIFHSTPHFQKIISGVVGSGAWLEDALPLDVYNSKSIRLKEIVDTTFAEVSGYIKVQSPSRSKEALKTVLINLWYGLYLQKPVRYYRDNSAYKSARRYGSLFFKKDRLLPVIDTLETLDYLYQKVGLYLFDKKMGFQTRMWASDKLLQQFELSGLCQPGFFSLKPPKEVIILKNNNKHESKTQYLDTPKTIRQREQLVRYNRYIDDSEITVVLDREAIVSWNFLTLYLHLYLIKGTTSINTVRLSRIHNPTQHNSNHIYYHHILSTMTQRKQQKALPVVPIIDYPETEMLKDYIADVNTIARTFEDAEASQTFLSQESRLKDLGIEALELRLCYEYLHRVYNRKSFKFGGRAYGALHQNLPKAMRSSIRINGQETVELDFSAYHIMMLYHMEGIDYRQDPYSICEGPAMRPVYKAVGLISINAKDDRSAYGAIREELENRGLSLPKLHKQPLVSLVNTFKQAHKPIQKYLFSDIGTKLQNKDSNIMNAILVRLMDMEILGLSVYDSVIVQAQHKEALEAVMVEEYEKQMGFKLG